ncbi:F-box/kelch-repeat protein SKIP4 [Aristolochia californica]|uniref:F-box/kelch-repeat protein SKIP4 n=1 Tax=Aristolochia californica TaxID=171875 RepID=UPI0035DC345A
MEILQSESTPPPLMNGLPDDLALLCLARVPRRYHHILKCVSKGWRALICSEEWSSHRQKHNLEEYWIYALCRDSSEVARLYVLDPLRRCWKPVEGIPSQCSKRKGMACQALGKKLYLLGGCRWSEDATKEVFCYDVLKNTWDQAAPMSISRCYCACEALCSKLYVVGGVGLTSSEMNSWDIYDSKSNVWTPLTDPHLFPDVEQSMTFDGKIYIRPGGWTIHTNVNALVYDPSSSQSWQTVDGGMVRGWIGPTVVVDGTLYMLDQNSGVMLMRWREGSQQWNALGRLSPWLAKPPCRLAAIGRSIFVIGKGLTTMVMDLDNIGFRRGVMVSSSIPSLSCTDDIIFCKAVAI